MVWYLSCFGDKYHYTSCRISCAVAKANQFVPVAVFFYKHNLSCTDLCLRYGGDMCKNAITKDVTLQEGDGHDVCNLVDFYKALLLWTKLSAMQSPQ